jgi:hypothetical protein
VKVGGLALLAALGVVFAAPASAEAPEDSIRGLITEVSRSAEVVLVEEDPSEESGSAKGEYAVTGETEILEGRGGDQTPASFEDLRVGQVVEATYDGPVAESYPTQGVAGRIVILDEADTPTVLPDTGGVPVLVLGVSLIAGGLLARRLALQESEWAGADAERQKPDDASFNARIRRGDGSRTTTSSLRL